MFDFEITKVPQHIMQHPEETRIPALQGRHKNIGRPVQREPHILLRHFRSCAMRANSQGFALGYLISPRWG
jgi:hypothetical protein